MEGLKVEQKILESIIFCGTFKWCQCLSMFLEHLDIFSVWHVFAIVQVYEWI